MTTSAKKKTEENLSERLLQKVYIVVCYFSLIIFSTVGFTLFATHFASCAHYHYSIEVKFDFDFDFYWCVDIGFRSITFVGDVLILLKVSEGYIIVKYRSGTILVIIFKTLAKLWPFFDLVFVGVLILVSAQ